MYPAGRRSIERPPPPPKWNGRNHDWIHLYNADVISIPDKWIIPVAGDLAFSLRTCARRSHFAKCSSSSVREWYLIPTDRTRIEWSFGINPRYTRGRHCEATSRKRRGKGNRASSSAFL